MSAWSSIRTFFANLAEVINEKRPLRTHRQPTMYDYNSDFKTVPAFNKFYDIQAVTHFLSNQWNVNTTDAGTDGIVVALSYIREQLKGAIERRLNHTGTEAQAILLFSHSPIEAGVMTQVKDIIRWFMDAGVYVITIRKWAKR